MGQGLRARIYGSRLYDLSLGNRPAAPAGRPSVLWPGPVVPSPAEDSFAWLSAISGPDRPLEISAARAQVERWLSSHRQWTPDAWRGDRLGDRLTFGLTYFQALVDGAPDAFRTALATALNRQARHLFRLPAGRWSEVDGFSMRRGAVMAALYMPAYRRRLPDAIESLLADIRDHVYPDGGHVARQPLNHLAALAALVHVRAALADSGAEVPEIVQAAIDRMAPMLRAYCHGDGRLALFNGAQHGDGAIVERVLALSGSRAKAASSAPHTGFHRIANQRTAVIFDAGAPAMGAPRVPGHAGTLSFEMSVGPHRMIVNCGNLAGAERAANPGLFEALRASAAHSSLAMADTHSSDLEPGGGFGSRRARNVTVRRREQDRDVLVEASHDGYVEPFGIVHRRSLYLARDGLDLRGEDTLEAEAGTGRTFDIRFHLHPAVKASLAEGGKSALLRLPTGRGWRLTVSDGALSLEESLYAGDGQPAKSAQIVISGRHARRRTVTKWRVAREG